MYASVCMCVFTCMQVGCGNVEILTLHTITHTFSECLCADWHAFVHPFVAYCVCGCAWVCDKASVCLRESEETLKSLEGDFL